MTAETDADASEDEHIKALFAEVDSNKDGKVVFSRVFFLSFSHYLVLHAPKPVPSARRFFSIIQQVDFDEYLGEDDKVVDAQAQAPANQDKPATAA